MLGLKISMCPENDMPYTVGDVRKEKAKLPKKWEMRVRVQKVRVVYPRRGFLYINKEKSQKGYWKDAKTNDR